MCSIWARIELGEDREHSWAENRSQSDGDKVVEGVVLVVVVVVVVVEVVVVVVVVVVAGGGGAAVVVVWPAADWRARPHNRSRDRSII